MKLSTPLIVLTWIIGLGIVLFFAYVFGFCHGMSTGQEQIDRAVAAERELRTWDQERAEETVQSSQESNEKFIRDLKAHTEKQYQEIQELKARLRFANNAFEELVNQMGGRR